jgi:hypothetical protein
MGKIWNVICAWAYYFNTRRAYTQSMLDNCKKNKVGISINDMKWFLSSGLKYLKLEDKVWLAEMMMKNAAFQWEDYWNRDRILAFVLSQPRRTQDALIAHITSETKLCTINDGLFFLYQFYGNQINPHALDHLIERLQFIRMTEETFSIIWSQPLPTIRVIATLFAKKAWIAELIWMFRDLPDGLSGKDILGEYIRECLAVYKGSNGRFNADLARGNHTELVDACILAGDVVFAEDMLVYLQNHYNIHAIFSWKVLIQVLVNFLYTKGEIVLKSETGHQSISQSTEAT